MKDPWTTFRPFEESRFSVGLPPNVDELRKQAEDKLCRVVFRKRDREGEFKPKIWEKVISAIVLASDVKIREFFGDE